MDYLCLEWKLLNLRIQRKVTFIYLASGETMTSEIIIFDYYNRSESRGYTIHFLPDKKENHNISLKSELSKRISKLMLGGGFQTATNQSIQVVLYFSSLLGYQ